LELYFPALLSSFNTNMYVNRSSCEVGTFGTLENGGKLLVYKYGVFLMLVSQLLELE